MKFTRDEEGVSPVIGVILMVAITVILAAVIAVFVFGLAGDLESSGQKDVTLKTGVNTAGNITFTIFAGSDVGTLSDIHVTDGSLPTDFAGPFSMGEIHQTVYPKSGPEVVITAEFNDGTQQVVATVK